MCIEIERNRGVILFFMIITISIMVPLFLSAYEYSDYVNYYSEEQIHGDWIDLNKNGEKDIYEDTELPPEIRADDLVSRMTLEEVVDQIALPRIISSPLPRLGIPPHQIGMEALHGVAGNGKASEVGTIIPNPIGLAGTGNEELIKKAYTAIGNEERAHYNSGQCAGLWFFSPPVLDPNRDGRWQRCEESFGEDPYLAARMGVVAILGFQGEDDNVKYRKTISCTKHFPSNRGPLGMDHPFTELKGPPSERITREVTFPPYKAAVMEGNVGSVMASYYRRPSGAAPDGTPICFSRGVLTGVLRREWGFRGYVVADGSALENQLNYVDLGPEDALKAGLDIDYDYGYQVWEHGGSTGLVNAVENGRIEIQELRRAARRFFKSWFELGVFDPKEMVPYSKIKADTVCCKTHIELALQTARESIVLLKNEGELLPVNKNIKSLALIGPSADKSHFGGYTGTPPYSITVLGGIKNRLGDNTEIRAVTEPVVEREGMLVPTEELIEKAVNIAAQSELAVVVLGPPDEGEGHTRKDLDLPEGHMALLKAVLETGTPTITVLINGSPMANRQLKEEAPAIIEAWYPGMEGGNAIAEVIFGDYNPGGMLSITIPEHDIAPLYYNHKDELDYSEETYLWPFGYGLSYTDFEYSNLRITPRESEDGRINIKVDIKNTGEIPGDRVVQLYTKDEKASIKTPTRQLRGFRRVSLESGKSTTVEFNLNAEDLSLLDTNFNQIVEPGIFRVMIGKSSQDIILEDDFKITELIEIRKGHKVSFEKLVLEKLEVKANEVFQASATFTNSGELTSWEEVELYIDGKLHSKKKESIIPGEEREITFAVNLYEPGKHTLRINDLQPKEFIIKEREPYFLAGNLRVSPRGTATEGNIKISADITNYGSHEGEEKVHLQVDDDTVETKMVTVPSGPGGITRTVHFTLSIGKPGKHEISVNNSEPIQVFVWDEIANYATHEDIKPEWITDNGRFGRAVELKEDEYIQLIDKLLRIPADEKTFAGTSAFFPHKGGFSIAFWFRPSKEEWEESILFDATNSPIYFDIFCTHEDIGWEFESADDNEAALSANLEFKRGEWYHVVTTGRFESSGPHELFVNGEKIDSVMTDLNFYGRTSNPRIGYYTDTYHSPNRGFEGAIDEFRIYRRILTPEEIKEIYTNNAPVTEGRVIHLSFD